jgi:transposase-like protein
MANKQRDPQKEHFWRRHVQRWQRSRLSVRDYCRRHQLGEASFYAWRRTLAERARQPEAASPDTVEPDAPLFVDVHLTAAATALELLLADGLVLRVPRGFDAETLVRLLDTLRSQPC